MSQAEHEPESTNCLNCQTPLAGEYCSWCGQRAGREDVRFSDVVAEFAGEIFMWDSRFWRTVLPLLIRPGFVTAEYLNGRRARYVAPLRLYLFISFILFVVLSISPDPVVRVGEGEVATGAGPPPVEIEQMESIVHEVARDVGAATSEIDEGHVSGGAVSGEGVEEIPPWLASEIERLEINAKRLDEDPGLLFDRLLDYLPQLMFLVMPVFALLLSCCYLFTHFHYLQHLIFALHYHSFAFLLFLIDMGVSQIGVAVDGVVGLVLACYLPLALRRVYGSGKFVAVAIAALIYISYFVMLVVALVAASLLIVAMM